MRSVTPSPGRHSVERQELERRRTPSLTRPHHHTPRRRRRTPSLTRPHHHTPRRRRELQASPDPTITRQEEEEELQASPDPSVQRAGARRRDRLVVVATRWLTGVRRGSSPCRQLTIEQVAPVAWEADFRGEDLVLAVAITQGRSGLRAGAVGDESLVTGTWGPSIELFQVRTLRDQEGTGGPRTSSGSPMPVSTLGHVSRSRTAGPTSRRGRCTTTIGTCRSSTTCAPS